MTADHMRRTQAKQWVGPVLAVWLALWLVVVLAASRVEDTYIAGATLHHHADRWPEDLPTPATLDVRTVQAHLVARLPAGQVVVLSADEGETPSAAEAQVVLREVRPGHVHLLYRHRDRALALRDVSALAEEVVHAHLAALRTATAAQWREAHSHSTRLAAD